MSRPPATRGLTPATGRGRVTAVAVGLLAALSPGCQLFRDKAPAPSAVLPPLSSVAAAKPDAAVALAAARIKADVTESAPAPAGPLPVPAIPAPPAGEPTAVAPAGNHERVFEVDAETWKLFTPTASPAPPTPAPPPRPAPPATDTPVMPASVPAPSATPAPKPLPDAVTRPTAVPAPTPPPAAPPAGPITVGGAPMSADALTVLLDGANPQPAVAGGCETCGGGGRQCAPGRGATEQFYPQTLPGRFIGAVYDAVVRPDPCYQPKWEPIANAALFTDGARPVGQTGFRWDYNARVENPDRGEYLWARADGKGKGPGPTAPLLGEPRVDYHVLNQFVEIASGNFSTTISTRYLSVNPQVAPSAAGFGDMIIGTKSLLFDSELFMLSMQFNTYIPIGNFGKGLGTGHVSLEPGLIAGLRLSPTTYLQTSINEWIPIAGDQDYAGALLRYGASVNQILWRPVRDLQLIGTFELNGYSFQDGAYTDAVLGPYQKASGTSVVELGPGMRLFFGNKLDVGIGSMHAVTSEYIARTQLRTELRYRF